MAAGIEPFYGELGRRLHRLRAAAGLTQEQLGARLAVPVTRASIANIETGKQRVLAKMLVDLATALAVDVTDLLPEVPREDDPEDLDLDPELRQKLGPGVNIKKLTASIRGGDRRRKS